MTRVAKVLCIFVAFASLAFLGLAAASSAGRTNWKTYAAEFPTRIQAQKTAIQELDDDIARWETRLKDAVAAIQQDVKAIAAREKVLEAQLQAVNVRVSQTSQQIADVGRKAQAIRDEGKLRREEGVQLANQLAELRAQKAAGIAERQQLTALLVQAIGTRDRLERRRKSLESEGARLGGAYDPAAEPENDPAAPGAESGDLSPEGEGEEMEAPPEPQDPPTEGTEPSVEEPAAEDTATEEAP